VEIPEAFRRLGAARAVAATVDQGRAQKKREKEAAPARA
jgi:hypothetical protein